MGALLIEPVAFDDPVAEKMIAAAMADLAARYGGGGDETPVDPSEFAPPGGGFFVALLDGEPVGCGGWRTLHADPTVAEVKRMFTLPEYRGTGVASALLGAVERSALAAGKRRAVLETGLRQPEAIAMYGRRGYVRIANFGYYRDEPGCVSFGRDLG